MCWQAGRQAGGPLSDFTREVLERQQEINLSAHGQAVAESCNLPNHLAFKTRQPDGGVPDTVVMGTAEKYYPTPQHRCGPPMPEGRAQPLGLNVPIDMEVVS